MQKLILLGALLLSSSALAFNGTPRTDWLGKSIKDTALPHSQQPTVYIFVQPDCAACSLQLGALSTLQKSNPKLQITLVTEQNSVAFKEYLSGFALNPLIYADTTGESIKSLALKTIPAVMYVNSAGIIEGFYEGALTNAETRELGSALIAGKPVPQLVVPGGIGSLAPALPNVDWASSKNHLLVFHSATCHFCEEELPYLLEYAKKHPEVAIWIIAPDNIEAVEKQFSGASANLKVFKDSNDQNAGGSLYNAYKTQGTPTQILVSDKGVIKWTGFGFNGEKLNPFQEGVLPID